MYYVRQCYFTPNLSCQYLQFCLLDDHLFLNPQPVTKNTFCVNFNEDLILVIIKAQSINIIHLLCPFFNNIWIFQKHKQGKSRKMFVSLLHAVGQAQFTKLKIAFEIGFPTRMIKLDKWNGSKVIKSEQQIYKLVLHRFVFLLYHFFTHCMPSVLHGLLSLCPLHYIYYVNQSCV